MPCTDPGRFLGAAIHAPTPHRAGAPDTAQDLPTQIQKRVQDSIQIGVRAESPWATSIGAGDEDVFSHKSIYGEKDILRGVPAIDLAFAAE